METPQQYEITGLGLSSNKYTVEQTGQDKNFRPEYEARNITGQTIFRCTYNTYEGETSFVDDDDNELLTIAPSGTLDIAGDYLLTDSQTGDDLVVLDNDFSFFQDTWRIHDAQDGSLVAKVTSGGGLITIARKFLPVGQFIGHNFEIADAAGNSIGTIESDFAIRDQYEIKLSDSSSVPIDPIVVATVVIDTIQGN